MRLHMGDVTLNLLSWMGTPWRIFSSVTLCTVGLQVLPINPNQTNKQNTIWGAAIQFLFRFYKSSIFDILYTTHMHSIEKHS